MSTRGKRSGSIGAAATLLILAALIASAVPRSLQAQGNSLSLDAAVTEALRARPSLMAAEQQISAAEARRRQAGARANAQFEFSSENLRLGEPYSPNADTMAVLTQPLDIVGKRGARIALGTERVNGARSDAELDRLTVVRTVTLDYWRAREAQEARVVIEKAVRTFDQVIAYHAAQLQAGTIPEQDLLRVRLEGERLKIAAGLGALDATRARIALLRSIGRPVAGDIALSDALDGEPKPFTPRTDEDVVARSPEVRRAASRVAEASADVAVQRADGRPDVAAVVGYKRTALSDASIPANTLVAGVRLTVPWADRNGGNREAAEAEVRRQQFLLDDIRAGTLADYHAALGEFELRRQQITEIVRPLREHATAVAQIAEAAYQQGGMELLRLLDARRAQLDADLAWVRAMADWQRSAALVRLAAGESR